MNEIVVVLSLLGVCYRVCWVFSLFIVVAVCALFEEIPVPVSTRKSRGRKYSVVQSDVKKTPQKSHLLSLES